MQLKCEMALRVGTAIFVNAEITVYKKYAYDLRRLNRKCNLTNFHCVDNFQFPNYDNFVNIIVFPC